MRPGLSAERRDRTRFVSERTCDALVILRTVQSISSSQGVVPRAARWYPSYERMQIEVHTRRRFGAREEDIAGWHVVRVTGEVDANTAGMLPTLVLYAVRRGAEQVCLDLSDLERVDRSGAEALRRCTRAARHAGGRLAMIEPDDPGVAEVLADTGVAHDVPVVSQREQLAAHPPRPRRGDAPRGATRPRPRSRAG